MSERPQPVDLPEPTPPPSDPPTDQEEPEMGEVIDPQKEPA